MMTRSTTISFQQWLKDHNGDVSQLLFDWAWSLSAGQYTRVPAPTYSTTVAEVANTSFSAPLATDADEAQVLMNFRVLVNLTEDDWGSALLSYQNASQVVVDMTDVTHQAEAGAEGGHLEWSMPGSVGIVSGDDYVLSATNKNIDYSDPNANVAICGYELEVYPLEPGGRKKPCDCGCSENNCQSGGMPGSVARSAGGIDATRSGAGAMSASFTETDLYWGGSFGVFRGLGSVPGGKLELMTASLDEINSPALLSYNNPLASYLLVPQGGIVQGCRFELVQGARVIAFRYYENGAILPIGVDTWGGGKAWVSSVEGVSCFHWRTTEGELYTFDAVSGDFVSYQTPTNQVISDISISAYLNVVRENGAIRQIWNYWDGLLNVENVTDLGYRVALYTNAQVSGPNESTGLYAVTGEAFKSWEFSLNAEGTEFSVVEKTPGKDDYSVTWWKNGDAWCMKRGSGEDALSIVQTRTDLQDGTYRVVTEYVKNNVVSTRSAEIYRSCEFGALLLSRTEGYGSDGALTTQYGYDASGNQDKEIAPDGSVRYWTHDKFGRVVRIDEPWGANGRKKTDIRYKYTENASFSDEVERRQIRLYPATGKAVEVLAENKAYAVADGIKRVTTTATAEGVTQTSITETYLASVDNIHARGRSRMSQAINGVQTWYEYAACADYGALYTVTTETKVAGELVNGKSTRQVEWINAQGCTLREESFVLLMDGTWASVSSASYEFDNRNRWIKRTRGNGRVTQRELMCDGSVLWEIDEDGVRTDNAYDNARQLVESIRSAVTDGDVTITPETITSYTRDAEGRVLQTRTDTGAMTTIESTAYDLQGRVVSQIDVLGRVTTTSYSDNGLTETVTTPAGATFVSTRNPDGSVARECGTGQQERLHSYDLNGSCLRETTTLVDGTSLGQTITNGFGQTKVNSVPSMSGFIYTRHEYNNLGQLTKTYQDTGWNTARTAASLMEYDSFGHQVKQVLALADEPNATNSPISEFASYPEQREDGVYQVSVTRSNNLLGEMLTQSTAELISESTTLESKQISTDIRGNESTQWTEFGTGTERLSKSTIPTSVNMAVGRSVDGFILSQTDHAGVSFNQTRAYTATGMILTQTDGRNNTTTSVTDIAGRTVSVTDAAGNTETTVYDANFDQPSMVTDALGNTKCTTYDHRGRQVAYWGTGEQPILLGYDEADRRISLTTFRAGTEIISSDPSERTDGDVTQWTYHPATGLELSKIYADGSSELRTYDAFNRLATITDARGVVKTHTYDVARGLLLSESYSDSTTGRSYTYNFLALPIQITDDTGVRSWGYGSYNELVTDSLVADGVTHLITELLDDYGRSVGYTYAKNGSVQQTVSTGYSSDGRITTAGFMHGGAVKQFNYAYLNGTNLLQTLTMSNNMSLTQGFEEKRDLLTQMAYKRGNTLVSQRVYTYDALGRPLTRQTSRNGQTVNDSFVHTYRSELASAQVNGQTYAYDYDNIGNRRMSIDASDYAFYDANGLNQYSSIRKNEESAFVPTFDAAGNQTLVRTSTGTWSVSYNAENRPVIFQKTTDSVTTRITCTYDYMGRRATKKVEEISTDAEGNETTTIISNHRFIYRGYLQIGCCDLTRANHPCLWLITWDPTQPVATRPLAIQKDGTWFCYGWDLTKNICEVFGQNGYIRSTYTYTPFGGVTASGDATQPIQWSSEHYDSELALVYYNYRHYNPTDGRWINRDPIAEQGRRLEFVWVCGE